MAKIWDRDQRSLAIVAKIKKNVLQNQQRKDERKFVFPVCKGDQFGIATLQTSCTVTLKDPYICYI